VHCWEGLGPWPTNGRADLDDDDDDGADADAAEDASDDESAAAAAAALDIAGEVSEASEVAGSESPERHPIAVPGLARLCLAGWGDAPIDAGGDALLG
jgi:hypothetical protein